MNSNADTYLLTGGAGFIGSHLLYRLLEENVRVAVIDNFNDFYNYTAKVKNISDTVISKFYDKVTLEKERKLNYIYGQMKDDFSRNNRNKEKLLNLFTEEINSIDESFSLFFTDIRDKDKMDNIFLKNRIDTVIHLAAMAGVRPSFQDPLLYEEVNIKGTWNILELMKKYGLNRFICASSSSVYGDNPKFPFSEEDPIGHVLSPYAYTKKACEELGHLYWKYYDISVIMLRFFTVYGPRQRLDLAIHKLLSWMIQNREIPFFGDGSSGRDYTYIEDIISGIMKSIEFMNCNSRCYEIFNLGNSNVISLKEMVDTIAEISGYTPKLSMMDFQAGDMPVTYADISKSERLLGYVPGISFKEGIEKFSKWYKGKD